VAERIAKVLKFRLDSEGDQVKDFLDVPHRFVYAPHQAKENIVVPRHFSEHRPYLTVGYSDGRDEVIGDSAAAIYDAPGYVLAILSSRLHLLWTATVGGRIKTDFRYSNTLVYNTFPCPALSAAQMLQLEEHAMRILGAREEHAGKTIAWLYDSETMPASVADAHKELDDALETIYVGRPFKSDAERLEHLFKLYGVLVRKEQSGGAGSLAFKGRK
jgi:hypothetical protein